MRVSVCENINPVSAGGAEEMLDFFLLCGISTPEGLDCL